jgi:hypothetical protein
MGPRTVILAQGQAQDWVVEGGPLGGEKVPSGRWIFSVFVCSSLLFFRFRARYFSSSA